MTKVITSRTAELQPDGTVTVMETWRETAPYARRKAAEEAVSAISWNGLIWKRSRVELGLLILDGLRTRHALDQMVRAMGTG